MENIGGKRVWRLGLVVFGIALTLRILHVVAISRSSPFFAVLPGDLAAYDRWALRILEEGWLGREIFYQDPLYPYFLALFYKMFGRDFFWVCVAQGILGAMTSFIIVLMGARVFNRFTGVAAGLLYSLYGPAIFFDGLLLKVSLSAFLLTLAFYLLLRGNFKNVSTGQFASGFCLGLACLTRANFLLLLPVVLVVLSLGSWVRLPQRLAMGLIFAAGVLAALGPVLVRNYLVGGEFILTTAQAGQNFYIGHNPDASGTYSRLPFVRPDPLYEQEDFRKEAEKRTGRKMTPAEASRYWLQESIAYIRAKPLADLKLTGKKLLLFFSDYEIPDNHNYYFHKRYSGILQNLPLGFSLLAPFFLPGVLAMLFSRRRGPLLLFFIQATYVVSVVTFFVVSRYRLVALPLFCLSAGYGIFLLQQQVRLGRWRHFCLGLFLATGGFWLARQQPIAPYDFSHSFTDAGLAYEIKGEPARAMAAYRQAIKENPASLRALENLGRLQLQLKQYQAARHTYARILILDPGSVEAKFQIMRLDKLGY